MNDQKISHADGAEHLMKSIKFECKNSDKNNSYHFIAIKENSIQKIRVAIRNQTNKTTQSSHFKFHPQDEYDWLALIIYSKNEKRSWIIPKNIAIKHTSASEKNEIHTKKISLSLKTLTKKSLEIFENNWSLNR